MGCRSVWLRATLAVMATSIAAAAYAQLSPTPASQHVMVDAAALKWGPPPPNAPPGATLAVISGDPAKEGVPFIIRIKFPDGYRVAPHWHPTDENLTVLQGTILLGMGEKYDKAAMKPLGVGGYSFMPAKMAHFAGTKGETIIQLHGMGPFTLTYVNPDDDPSKQKKPSQ